MSSDDASDGDEQKAPDCSSPEVVTKYQLAAGIANKALEAVIQQCKPGAHIVELCDFGDKFITDETSKLYKKGDVSKGIGFPTSLSVNEIAGHYSPLSDDTTTLKDGDLVKIDLGVQIDGFVACVAHTIVLSDGPIEGRKADVVLAAWNAAQAVVRLMKPGEKNTTITQTFEKCATPFKCIPVRGVLSHEVRQFVIDGQNCILGISNPDDQVDDFEMAANRTFVIDVVMSTGEGKVIEREEKCTIYKRCVEHNYQLKLKASRNLIAKINKNFPTFPFTLRALEDPRAKLGITECRQRDLVQPYPVLSEKKDELVAQFKFTCILLPTGTLKITGLPLTQEFKSEFKIEDDELSKLIASSFGKKKRKKKKKKKKPAAKAE